MDIAQQTLASGHTLVNHSFTHRVALGDHASHAHAYRKITKTHALLGEHLGDWGGDWGGDTGGHWFRPFGRGGELGQHLLSQPAVQELAAQHYSVLLWNSVPRDWENAHGWTDIALREIEAQQHTVLVLHDLNTGAMGHLGQFLDTLLERGDAVTTDLPRDCVPMRIGARVWAETEFNGLIAAEAN